MSICAYRVHSVLRYTVWSISNKLLSGRSRGLPTETPFGGPFIYGLLVRLYLQTQSWTFWRLVVCLLPLCVDNTMVAVWSSMAGVKPGCRAIIQQAPMAQPSICSLCFTSIKHKPCNSSCLQNPGICKHWILHVLVKLPDFRFSAKRHCYLGRAIDLISPDATTSMLHTLDWTYRFI